jgi:transcriptional regulator with XRE-family HTH domain
MKKRPVRQAGPHPEPVELNLGERLRRLRTERRLSVRTLAARSGFSPSFVSQVELNHASPSIASLGRLAAALGVTLGDFFQAADTPGPAFTRAVNRPRLTSWWSRARIEALSPVGAGSPFQAVLITLSSGGASGRRPQAQTGPRFAVVIEGRVRLTLGEQAHLLAAGDAVTFNAELPHRWENPDTRSARLLIVSLLFTA